MLKAVIIFGAGLYTGVYVAQNYQIDKVEDPKKLFQMATDYISGALDGKKGDEK